jgi:lysophospholipase L1-like esterase
VSERTSKNGVRWQPTWTQAMTDFRGEDDEAPFEDVTVRMTVQASIGGDSVRVELSNRFGDEPVRIGHAAISVVGRSVDLRFGGLSSIEIPVGQSLWSDAVELPIKHGDDVVVDLYLPEHTPYATANGFAFDRSVPGDFAGQARFPLERSAPEEVDASREFPAANTGTAGPDGTGWSLPAGGPFLRTIEVQGPPAKVIVVCLGSSSMAMGWPQYAAAMLPADARTAVLNRGIAGNRILLDAPAPTPSWGRAGLTRFEEDVLGSRGATHLVIAYNSNDFGLPGRVTPDDEMPNVQQLIDGYQQLADNARTAGLEVILGTINPLSPELAADPERERFRVAVNEWIRTNGIAFVDLDEAIRDQDDPTRIDDRFGAPDHTHPNVNGEKRLAQALVFAIAESCHLNS